MQPVTRALGWIGDATLFVLRTIAVAALLIGGLWLVGRSPTLAVAVLLLWVLPVFVGWRLCESKERDSPFALAVFLGWLGVLIALTLPPAGRRCPSCDELIRRGACVCRFCGRNVTPFRDV